MKYKFFIFLFVFFAFIALASASIVINEVMPNPNTSGYDEWIEIYNSENNILNLSEWQLNISGKLYNITCEGISDCNLTTNATYFIVLWKKASISNITNDSIVYFNSSGSGNYWLNNSGAELSFFNLTYIDSFSYNSSEKGKSWARLENGTFIICSTPTPGAQNNCTQQQQEKSLELIYPPEVQCNENFSITIKAHNFDEGIYDIKIDILDSEDERHRVGKVWNGTRWLSTNFYVKSALNVIRGEGTTTLNYKIKNFGGEAILRPRIRKSGSSSSVQFDDYLLLVNCEQANQQKDSSITIINAPTSAKFGDKIEVELEVYKGDTAKYAVYVYVEDDDGTKVSDKIDLHFDKKFTNYNRVVTLTLKCKNEHGTYKIIAEGLGTSDEKEIDLTECNENESRREEEMGEGTTIGDFTYTLTIPNTIYLNQKFQVKIKITNNGDEDKNFQVWSYVYRASKCYSCEDDNREANVKTVEVKSNSFSEIVLENMVGEESGATAGNYKLKIKVLQKGLKTPKEFTYNISLIAPKDNETQTTQQTQSAQSSPSFYSQYSSRIIESESFSLAKVTPYILSSLLLVLVIYLIIKKI